MTLVLMPKRKHSCDIDWQSVPWLPTDIPAPPPGYTHRMEMVHHDDPPGTVRRCEECGRHWVAVRNRPGMAGVYWRPERGLKRWRRARAERRTDSRPT